MRVPGVAENRRHAVRRYDTAKRVRINNREVVLQIKRDLEK